ncbi:MAG: RES domain-containing protein [Mesorhizobium sp.]|nr:RES domain-containing protein [Mesorhizobium sp.]MBL8577431.1 RES domain-containing protein [Mesorhizobium sp.]
MPESQPERPIVLWRAYVPRWAHMPLSGEGASRFGGRWNPVGAPTIYAARELSTAWAEYNQGFVQHPALIAQLELSKARLADLTDDDTLQGLGVGADIHLCEWRAIMDGGRVPPTHKLRTRLLKERFHGVIYPSFMSSGGSCVALWRWNKTGHPRLDVIDPESRMPRSAASWL